MILASCNSDVNWTWLNKPLIYRVHLNLTSNLSAFFFNKNKGNWINSRSSKSVGVRECSRLDKKVCNKVRGWKFKFTLVVRYIWLIRQCGNIAPRDLHASSNDPGNSGNPCVRIAQGSRSGRVYDSRGSILLDREGPVLHVIQIGFVVLPKTKPPERKRTFGNYLFSFRFVSQKQVRAV